MGRQQVVLRRGDATDILHLVSAFPCSQSITAGVKVYAASRIGWLLSDFSLVISSVTVRSIAPC